MLKLSRMHSSNLVKFIGKISGGDQLAGLLESWIRLILLLPLLLLEAGRTGGQGNGPFHKPVLASFSWASHLWSRDIYSPMSATPKQKNAIEQ